MSHKKEFEAGGLPEGQKESGHASDMPEAARRALEEAEKRREAIDVRPSPPPELGGRKGPDPVRYGDWEKDGIISDF